MHVVIVGCPWCCVVGVVDVDVVILYCIHAYVLLIELFMYSCLCIVDTPTLRETEAAQLSLLSLADFSFTVSYLPLLVQAC